MSVARSARRAVSVLSLAIVLGGCSGDINAQQPPPPEPIRQAQAPAPSAPTTGAAARAVLPDFSALVEKYGPAVVNVEVEQRAQTSRGLSPDDPLSDFFRRFGIPPERFSMPDRGNRAPLLRGAGSGFIVSPDGYILTNAHVVQGADRVKITLNDRRAFQAKVIGIDQRTDVAVLKIDAQNLPTVKIGDPSKVKPGQWVLAIGSPFGLENTATAGIVSATSRSLGAESTYVPFIQTDVAVNPGNSGGPLFNLDGEVVGINSQIFSRTGGYMGLSFAIPIDVAMDVRDQLIKTGRVVRGRIGVQIQAVDAELAESFGLDRPRGALVNAVADDGPALKAGVKPGDVILEVDGRIVERSSDLPTMIARLKPGTKTKLTVWRNGREQTLSVPIVELDEEPQLLATSGRADQGSDSAAAKLGLAVRPLRPQEKEQIETEGNLVVEQVSGPAADAGVEPGDIILGVNGKPVKSVSDLQAATKDAGKAIGLLIQRGGQQFFLPLRLS
ncbi:MAG TPA: DegQ family serine endoprotease [Steroidobacteraceae bacterium]